MKLAIISDVHDNYFIIDKFFQKIKNFQIDTILCCGDIGHKKTLNYILNIFKKNFYMVLGNADLDIDPINKKEIVIFPEKGKLILNNKKIALIHNINHFNKKEINDFDYIFYGHTHYPWIKKNKNTYLVNPGCLSENNYSTFAILNTKNNKLKLIKIERK